MEKKRSRYQTVAWLRARERIGQLVRENYLVSQEMSPRLAAFIKTIEDGSLPTEMLRGETQDDQTSRKGLRRIGGVIEAPCAKD
jgi:hypothetical protein